MAVVTTTAQFLLGGTTPLGHDFIVTSIDHIHKKRQVATRWWARRNLKVKFVVHPVDVLGFTG